MSIFKKQRIDIQPAESSRVEIELQKDATKKAVETAKRVNESMKELLVENGFTLKIYLATGGHIKTNRKEK